MISRPMRRARKGTGPRIAVRSLTKSFWVVKARFAPMSRAQVGEGANVRGRVGMVVGKDLQVQDVPAKRIQSPAESFGVADAAEGGDLLAGQLGQRVTWPSPSIRSSGAWRASRKGHARGHASTSRRIGSRAAGSSRSARERTTADARRSERYGLAQEPTGKQPPQTERVEGVEHDDVEIARQPAMLEPVVEDDQLCLQFERRRSRRSLTAVRVLKVGDVGQVLLEDQALVVDAAGVAVSPADQGHADAPAAIPSGDPLDHRRLAGSAQRDVAHRDHRHRRPVAALPALVVGRVAGRRPPGRRRPEPEPQSQPRQVGQAPRPAANQSQIARPG